MLLKTIEFDPKEVDRAYVQLKALYPELAHDLGELRGLEEPWDSELLIDLINEVARHLARLGYVDNYTTNKKDAAHQLSLRVSVMLWTERSNKKI